MSLSELKICATEPRFCLDHSVTLKLRENSFSWSGDDFKVSCQSTGVVYFQCHGHAFSFREKKVLRDTYGEAVANIKEKYFSLTDEFTIYAGDNSEKKLCKCYASLNFIKSKLSTTFTDVITGNERLVVLKGNWREKTCVIYLGEPKEDGIPIARIDRPFSFRASCFGMDKYYLEVSPGVDIALMVMLCIALDEHSRD